MPPLLRLVPKDEPYPDPPMVLEDEFEQEERLPLVTAIPLVVVMALVLWCVVAALAELGDW